MKQMATAMILVLVYAAGCDRTSTSRHKPANERQVILPAHPVLADIAGKWGSSDKPLVTITLLPDGLGLLEIAEPGEGWRIEVSNGRIENGKISYDQKYHVSDVPNHPMDGAQSTVALELVPSAKDRIKMTSTSQDSQVATATLARLE